jgi:hypothetical protein
MNYFASQYLLSVESRMVFIMVHLNNETRARFHVHDVPKSALLASIIIAFASVVVNKIRSFSMVIRLLIMVLKHLVNKLNGGN